MMFWLAIIMVLNMNWGKRDPKGIKSKVEGDSFVWFNIQCVASHRTLFPNETTLLPCYYY